MSKGREKAAMTDEQYLEVFFLPAMQLIAAEKADGLGAPLVRWLCTGEQPDLTDEDDRLCWNLLMMKMELTFNPQVSVSDFIHGEDEKGQ